MTSEYADVYVPFREVKRLTVELGDVACALSLAGRGKSASVVRSFIEALVISQSPTTDDTRGQLLERAGIVERHLNEKGELVYPRPSSRQRKYCEEAEYAIVEAGIFTIEPRSAPGVRGGPFKRYRWNVDLANNKGVHDGPPTSKKGVHQRAERGSVSVSKGGSSCAPALGTSLDTSLGGSVLPRPHYPTAEETTELLDDSRSATAADATYAGHTLKKIRRDLNGPRNPIEVGDPGEP